MTCYSTAARPLSPAWEISIIMCFFSPIRGVAPGFGRPFSLFSRYLDPSSSQEGGAVAYVACLESRDVYYLDLPDRGSSLVASSTERPRWGPCHELSYRRHERFVQVSNGRRVCPVTPPEAVCSSVVLHLWSGDGFVVSRQSLVESTEVREQSVCSFARRADALNHQSVTFRAQEDPEGQRGREQKRDRGPPVWSMLYYTCHMLRAGWAGLAGLDFGP